MLKTIITAILSFFAWWLKKETKPTQETGKVNEPAKQAMAKRIKNAPKMPVVVLLLLGGMLGCNRTVYVPDGSVVRLRETVKGVDVWVDTNSGWVAGKIDLQEGWYCAPLTDEEIKQQQE
jgi:hypothetical protein